MKQAEARAYDTLPQLLQGITDLTRHMHQLPVPLEDALAACDRVAAAGCYTAGGRLQAVTPDVAARQRRLVENAIAFRDACVATLTSHGVQDG